MHDYSYSAHLVINDGYEDRLDMKISCQNAQQRVSRPSGRMESKG